jgi:uncharacterized protein (DUF736 family)
MENTEKPKLEEAGAFWIKKSKTGNQFLTGKIKSKSGEEISVMVFKNKYKTEGSNQPDYRIYFDNNNNKKLEEVIPVKSDTSKKAQAQAKEEKPVEAPKSEEIPF